MATPAPGDAGVTPEMVDLEAPPSVIIRSRARAPVESPTLGVPLAAAPLGLADTGHGPAPRHRLVVIGDSIAQGFQSGAIFNTDLSWPKIVAWELGWDQQLRAPRYDGFGGLPLNLEYLVRGLEQEFGATLNWWESPLAAFRVRTEMDRIEDWWERGGGAARPSAGPLNHNLGVYGWDVRDALSRSYAACEAALAVPRDDLLRQLVEDANDRAALRVLAPRLPHASAVQLANALGQDGGIETLVVALGANNALGSVVSLKPSWTKDTPVGDGVPAYRHLGEKRRFNVWDPDHFNAEWDELVVAVSAIEARHVIVATVPHVTIAPVARGTGNKVRTGSRFYPFYTRPWVDPARFDPRDDDRMTAAQARAIDAAVDQYNEHIVDSVARQRRAGRDWYVLDLCGLLDRLAHRRYIEDVNARPEWWRPYELPAALRALTPVPDSRFFSSDSTGRLAGGLFSLDGIHPTTIGYGLIAQEVIRIMELAQVDFFLGDGRTKRPGPITVDFERLLRRDTLISSPPTNLRNAIDVIGWLDESLDVFKRLARNLGG